MTNKIYKLIKQHIEDGLLLSACTLLKQQSIDDIRYYELYTRLQAQAFRMVQSIGPLPYNTYLEILMLNFPRISSLSV